MALTNAQEHPRPRAHAHPRPVLLHINVFHLLVPPNARRRAPASHAHPQAPVPFFHTHPCACACALDCGSAEEKGGAVERIFGPGADDSAGRVVNETETENKEKKDRREKGAGVVRNPKGPSEGEASFILVPRPSSSLLVVSRLVLYRPSRTQNANHSAIC
ncbi:hypothetical protein C8R45DRAFT_477374 [Mycena sanguinolenta]|nr:hypothetical protein C8R45DRAFT_477374 [Mycena sanguinolenta]